MLAAPVEARFTIDRSKARIGSEVVARLQMTALKEIPQLAISIATDGCMQVRSVATPASVQHVKKGQLIVATAKFKVTQTASCNIIAQVITFDDGKNRFSSVYGVAVNSAPAIAMPGLHKGVTKAGEATIDVPAAK